VKLPTDGSYNFSDNTKLPLYPPALYQQDRIMKPRYVDCSPDWGFFLF